MLHASCPSVEFLGLFEFKKNFLSAILVSSDLNEMLPYLSAIAELELALPEVDVNSPVLVTLGLLVAELVELDPGISAYPVLFAFERNHTL